MEVGELQDGCFEVVLDGCQRTIDAGDISCRFAGCVYCPGGRVAGAGVVGDDVGDDRFACRYRFACASVGVEIVADGLFFLCLTLQLVVDVIGAFEF